LTSYQTVSFSEDDYVSPPELVATTTAFFGGEIDLDPASSDSANSTVGATRFFSWKENGLIQDWKVRNIYLFPPKLTLSGKDQPRSTDLFTKNFKYQKSAQRVWLELAYKKWVRKEFEQAIIFLTSSEVALLVTQKINFDFPLCILSQRPKLLREKDLKPVRSKVFGFVYLLPSVDNYNESVRSFHSFYSSLGRVYV
jgi:hypothetical protein